MMEEGLKNRIILVISIVCLIFFLWASGVSRELSREKRNLQQETGKRMELEEESLKFHQAKAAFDEKASQLNAQLEEEKAALEEAKKSLSQELLTNKTIKEELEKVTRLKETLEDDLKDALMKKNR